MGRFFNLDSPVMVALTKMADLIIVNLLAFFCCLPIITVGASMTALHYVVLKIVRDEECYIVRSFFKSFKENFKQATGIGILVLVAGFICSFDIYYAVRMNQRGMLIIFTIMSIIYLFTVLYVFPLQAQFENTIKATIKNAFLLSIKNLPWTLLMAAITAAIIVACYFSSAFLGIMLICAAGLHAYLCSLILVHLFREYMPEEEDKPDEDFHLADNEDETKAD